eukprot:GHRQ01021804.1.p1 GENE.GHRQ01021804.1~~GHRQ01021804.1.p1  ORF type:complete len:146 (+),score=25.93 GHRQ01021804.1:489-926(+)
MTRLACPIVEVTGSSLNCTIPEAPAGSYQIVVQKANGQTGVDGVPSQPARVAYSPVVTAVSSGSNVAAGSVQGGVMLQLTSSAAAFNTTNPGQNKVSTVKSCSVHIITSYPESHTHIPFTPCIYQPSRKLCHMVASAGAGWWVAL